MKLYIKQYGLGRLCLILEIEEVQGGATVILCDIHSAIAISKNLIFHRKTKHIKVKYHFVKKAQNNVKSSWSKLMEKISQQTFSLNRFQRANLRNLKAYKE